MTECHISAPRTNTSLHVRYGELKAVSSPWRKIGWGSFMTKRQYSAIIQFIKGIRVYMYQDRM